MQAVFGEWNMATVASEIQVEIPDDIAKDAALAVAVAQANDYFGELYRTGPPLDVPGDLKLSWTINPSRTSLTTRFSEQDQDGERITKHEFPVSYMSDAPNRDIAMIRLWRSVLRARSDVIRKRIDELIRQMEEDEDGEVAG